MFPNVYREKHHICDVCGKELKSQFNLDHHMATLHGDKELTCPQCPKDNRNLCETYTRYFNTITILGNTVG